MKNSVLSCCLLSLIFVAAYSSEEPLVPDSQNRNEARSSFKITLNQALERAEQAFMMLDEENVSTRGGIHSEFLPRLHVLNPIYLLRPEAVTKNYRTQ